MIRFAVVMSMLCAAACGTPHEAERPLTEPQQVGVPPPTAVRFPITDASEVPLGKYVQLRPSGKTPRTFELERTADGFLLHALGTFGEPFKIPQEPLSDGTLKIPSHYGLAFYKDGSKTLMQVRFCYEFILTERVE